MCGIVGGIGDKNIVNFILQGLSNLEYRGYDSAGIAVIENNKLIRKRVTGRVKELINKVVNDNIKGNIAIGHTRWATHGSVNICNAHPHFSNNLIAVVHNGIIENYLKIKNELILKGYVFETDTDTEVIAHFIHSFYVKNNDLLCSVQEATKFFEGSYAIAVLAKDNINEIICANYGPPLILGLTKGGNYFSSDVSALLPITNNFVYLQDGDISKLTINNYKIFNKSGKEVNRKVYISNLENNINNLGIYKHYMQKEIFEQPKSILDTLDNLGNKFLPEKFGIEAGNIFKSINKIQIISCGTSYIAGLIAKYWIEDILGISCSVDISSEYRYSKVPINKNSLIISISQSGETADTISSIKYVNELGMHNTLSICNVPESTLVRLCKLGILMNAGPEIGVASTKAFTSQLIVLLYLIYTIKKAKGNLSEEEEELLIYDLKKIPYLISNVLKLEQELIDIADYLKEKNSVLFLGRNLLYPISIEGALKLKEISYIHAESYAAGELKHGPLALVDENMPVIVLMQKDLLSEKMKSNIQEILVRNGKVILFTDFEDPINNKVYKTIKFDNFSNFNKNIIPILYVIPLQMLAYHTALLRKCDVDKPRNLAKSVTVE